MKKKPICYTFRECIFRNAGFFKRFLGLLSLLVIGNIGIVMAQEVPKFTVNFKNASLVEVFDYFGGKSDYKFTYNSESVKGESKKISETFKNATLQQILTKCLEDTRFSFEIVGKNVVISLKKQPDVKLIEISGKVVDENGNSVPGATVLIQGTSQGVVTNIEGQYRINVRPTDILRVSFIGYKTEIVELKGRTKVNVRLTPDQQKLDEVQVVAFGTQKKESVVSAITTIRPMDLKSSSSDLTTSLTGKIAGIIGWQTGGAPGALTEEEMNTKFYIRGISSSNGASEPLILIDGVESSRLDLARMVPEDIESFSVLKDASATAMYGARGANGVILVTTKKGEAGSVYTSVRYEAVASMPTKEIEVVDPKTYMRMYNEALLTRNPNATPAYSLTKIERTGDPRYPSYVYPANDWYDILFKDYSVNHRVGVNVRGGSELMQYYASVNYTNDQGMLKTDRLNQFDVIPSNSTLSSRINLNVDLNSAIRLLVNTSFSIDKYHGPLAETSEAYALAFNASPVDFAPTYPGDKQYGWPHLRFGNIPGGPDSGVKNPYASLQAGYKERGRYSVTTRAEYIHNLSSLVKGLELRASVSLSKTGYDMNAFSTQPFYYWLNTENGGYDFETGEHTLTLVKSGRRTLQQPMSGGTAASSTTPMGI